MNWASFMNMAGGVQSAGADVLSGFATSSLLKKRAGVAAAQSQSAIAKGEGQADLYRMKLQQVMGAQNAQRGASNVQLSGSPLRVLEDTAAVGAGDIARLRNNAALEAWGFKTQGVGDEYLSKVAQNRGIFGGVGSLLASGAKSWSMEHALDPQGSY